MIWTLQCKSEKKSAKGKGKPILFYDELQTLMVRIRLTCNVNGFGEVSTSKII